MKILKIITGGQSGGDLSGNFFAKRNGIETEINAERNYQPLYDSIPTDIKINIVSNKEGSKGGWIERRKYNIKNSDFTLILLERSIEFTRGSKGTYNDCLKLKKDVMYIKMNTCIGSYHDKNLSSSYSTRIGSIEKAKEVLNSKSINVLNIAGERDLNKQICVDFLEKLLLD